MAEHLHSAHRNIISAGSPSVFLVRQFVHIWGTSYMDCSQPGRRRLGMSPENSSTHLDTPQPTRSLISRAFSSLSTCAVGPRARPGARNAYTTAGQVLAISSRRGIHRASHLFRWSIGRQLDLPSCSGVARQTRDQHREGGGAEMWSALTPKTFAACGSPRSSQQSDTRTGKENSPGSSTLTRHARRRCTLGARTTGISDCGAIMQSGCVC